MTKQNLLLAAILVSAGLSAGMRAQSPHVVFMIGEDEYHSWETLPEFAAKDLEPLLV